MSKSHLQTTAPSNLEDEVEQYQEENNLDHTSEAVRQLVERGIDDWNGSQPLGSDITMTAAKVSGMAGFLSAVIGFALASSELLFAAGAFSVFALFWLLGYAAIMAYHEDWEAIR